MNMPNSQNTVVIDHNRLQRNGEKDKSYQMNYESLGAVGTQLSIHVQS